VFYCAYEFNLVIQSIYLDYLFFPGFNQLPRTATIKQLFDALTGAGTALLVLLHDLRLLAGFGRLLMDVELVCPVFSLDKKVWYAGKPVYQTKYLHSRRHGIALSPARKEVLRIQLGYSYLWQICFSRLYRLHGNIKVQSDISQKIRRL
jgi:hypothetical protein